MRTVTRGLTLGIVAPALAFSSAWAAPERVSQHKQTEEFGPFLSYETTVTRYIDCTESVKYGKPHWGAPLLNDVAEGAANAAMEATVKRGIRAVFSDDYHGPVVNGFYVPAGKEDRFVTTDRDGKAISAGMRRKLSQRTMEGAVQGPEPVTPSAPGR